MLPKEWWGEAILTAYHVLNRVSTKKEIKPFEEQEKKMLNLSYLRTQGWLAKVNMPINKEGKLGPKIVNCVLAWLRYSQRGTEKVPAMHVGTIMKHRDATSFEIEFPMDATTNT